MRVLLMYVSVSETPSALVLLLGILETLLCLAAEPAGKHRRV